jgi:hypothetical protein
METNNNEKPTLGDVAVISEYGGLKAFNCLTANLTNNKKVKFIGKEDEADNIDWRFKYRGKRLTLQYNIYNGLSLSAADNRHASYANELAGSLRNLCQ